MSHTGRGTPWWHKQSGPSLAIKSKPSRIGTTRHCAFLGCICRIARKALHDITFEPNTGRKWHCVTQLGEALSADIRSSPAVEFKENLKQMSEHTDEKSDGIPTGRNAVLVE
ncbi:hypothetical protein Y032_0776g2265 [Ancylostoma ceylanicum]|uniref:Uncharacterized protein n=1 Tax=Ancylostoma ceylanicum TaxID=53326 RepID=A0A016WDF4_9BILA|nr:hypothetical protein Y032_0776g2265 [Ancylostoma ceylanicum]